MHRPGSPPRGGSSEFCIGCSASPQPREGFLLPRSASPAAFGPGFILKSVFPRGFRGCYIDLGYTTAHTPYKHGIPSRINAAGNSRGIYREKTRRFSRLAEMYEFSFVLFSSLPKYSGIKKMKKITQKRAHRDGYP